MLKLAHVQVKPISGSHGKLSMPVAASVAAGGHGVANDLEPNHAACGRRSHSSHQNHRCSALLLLLLLQVGMVSPMTQSQITLPVGYFPRSSRQSIPCSALLLLLLLSLLLL
jgi:hypothetical protein